MRVKVCRYRMPVLVAISFLLGASDHSVAQTKPRCERLFSNATENLTPAPLEVIQELAVFWRHIRDIEVEKRSILEKIFSEKQAETIRRYGPEVPLLIAHEIQIMDGHILRNEEQEAKDRWEQIQVRDRLRWMFRFDEILKDARSEKFLDNHRFVGIKEDEIFVYDLAKGKVIASQAHKLVSNTDVFAASPDGRWVYLVSSRQIKIWDLKDNAFNSVDIKSFVKGSAPFSWADAKVSRDGRLLTAVGSNGQLVIWDTHKPWTEPLVNEYIPNTKLTGKIEESPNGRYLLVADNHRFLWDRKIQKRIDLSGIDEHTWNFDLAKFSPDSKEIWFIGKWYLRTLNLETGLVSATPLGDHEKLTGFDRFFFTADGKKFVTFGTASKMNLQVFDRQTGTNIAFPEHPEIKSVGDSFDWNPNTQKLTVIQPAENEMLSVYIFDFKNWNWSTYGPFEMPAGRETQITSSPDGQNYLLTVLTFMGPQGIFRLH